MRKSKKQPFANQTTKQPAKQKQNSQSGKNKTTPPNLNFKDLS